MIGFSHGSSKYRRGGQNTGALGYPTPSAMSRQTLLVINPCNVEIQHHMMSVCGSNQDKYYWATRTRCECSENGKEEQAEIDGNEI